MWRRFRIDSSFRQREAESDMPKLFDAMIELMAVNEPTASNPAETPPPRPYLLTEDQIKVLRALDAFAAASPETAHRSLAAISATTGLSQKAVRACARALARHGLATFGRGTLKNDPYYRAGSGYAITKLGQLHMSELTSRANP